MSALASGLSEAVALRSAIAASLRMAAEACACRALVAAWVVAGGRGAERSSQSKSVFADDARALNVKAILYRLLYQRLIWLSACRYLAHVIRRQ